MKKYHKITINIIRLFLCFSLLTSCAYSNKKPTSVYYNPSLFSKDIDSEDRQGIAQFLSSRSFQVTITPYDMPADPSVYLFDVNNLGKSYISNIVNASADIGIVSTSDYIDLLKYTREIRAIAYFSEDKEGQAKDSCYQDSSIVAPLNTKIKSHEDLKTKRIGVLYPEQSSYFPSKVFLLDNIIPAQNVVIFYSIKEMKKALDDREIDGVIDSYSILTSSGIRMGFFRAEFSNIQDQKQNLKYVSILSTNYQFPCRLIYAKNTVSNERAMQFLINLKNALDKEQLAKFRIGKITTRISSKTLKRLEDVSTEKLQLYK